MRRWAEVINRETKQESSQQKSSVYSCSKPARPVRSNVRYTQHVEFSPFTGSCIMNLLYKDRRYTTITTLSPYHIYGGLVSVQVWSVCKFLAKNRINVAVRPPHSFLAPYVFFLYPPVSMALGLMIPHLLSLK